MAFYEMSGFFCGDWYRKMAAITRRLTW
jgi:hypothetical protein